MSFQRAVRATPGLAPHYRLGLQALRGQDAHMVKIAHPRRLDGSVDIDGALENARPNDPRWDYGVGIKRRTNRALAVWIEIHPASSSHVEGVLAKLAWLKNWLRNEAPAFAGIKTQYVWLASGRVALPKNNPKRKLIAQAGLTFRSQVLNLDEFAD